MGSEAARLIHERLSGIREGREIIDVGFEIVWRGTA
jgi:DNA-binding LacI/PurR family transcriptional regulator